MVDVDYKFLRFVEYKDLGVWDVKRYENKNVSWSKKHPIRKLSYFLKEPRINWVNINDDETYPILGVRTNGQGVYINRTSKGSDLKMRKYQISKPNHLFWCKVDTKNGAFGVIDEKHACSFGSSNMSYLEIDINKIDVEFFQLFFQIKKFQEYMDSLVIGVTNRKYISKQTILTEVNIPVPIKITEQVTIVSKYNSTISQAEVCETQANELEQGIDKLLFAELGINNVPELSTLSSQGKFFKLVDFDELIHWNVKKSTLEVKPKDLFVSQTYPNVMLTQYVSINPGTDFSDSSPSDKLTFLPMECISDVYGEIDTRYEGEISKSKGYTRFKNGDVLFAKITPCMQNGKCVVADELLNGYGYGSTEYHVIRPRNEKITSEYIHLFLRIKIARTLAQEFFTGSAGQQRVGEDFLENLSVPLPPPEKQKEIVKNINEVKQKIKSLRKQAEELRKKAKQDFEEEVF